MPDVTPTPGAGANQPSTVALSGRPTRPKARGRHPGPLERVVRRHDPGPPQMNRSAPCTQDFTPTTSPEVGNASKCTLFPPARYDSCSHGSPSGFTTTFFAQMRIWFSDERQYGTGEGPEPNQCA